MFPTKSLYIRLKFWVCQVEALATDNMRLNGIAEKLQHERSELQRKVHGLEASVKSFQAELNQRALSEGNSLKVRNALEQRLEDMQLVLCFRKSFAVSVVVLARQATTNNVLSLVFGISTSLRQPP